MKDLIIACAFCVVIGASLGFIVGLVLPLKETRKNTNKTNLRVIKGDKK